MGDAQSSILNSCSPVGEHCAARDLAALASVATWLRTRLYAPQCAHLWAAIAASRGGMVKYAKQGLRSLRRTHAIRPWTYKAARKWGEPLAAACASGDIEAAQWIAETFAFTPKDVRDNYNAPLLNSCEAGRLDIANWLVEAFDLVPRDAREDDNCALRLATKRGHQHIVEWLAARFNILAEELLGDNEFVDQAERKWHARRLAEGAGPLACDGHAGDGEAEGVDHDGDVSDTDAEAWNEAADLSE